MNRTHQPIYESVHYLTHLVDACKLLFYEFRSKNVRTMTLLSQINNELSSLPFLRRKFFYKKTFSISSYRLSFLLSFSNRVWVPDEFQDISWELVVQSLSCVSHRQTLHLLFFSDCNNRTSTTEHTAFKAMIRRTSRAQGHEPRWPSACRSHLAISAQSVC